MYFTRLFSALPACIRASSLATTIFPATCETETRGYPLHFVIAVKMNATMAALDRFNDHTALSTKRKEDEKAAKARMAADEERLRALGLTMDPLAGLPPEVVLLIFEFAAFTCKETCLSLCLVCSPAWKIATPILYESIWLDCLRLRSLWREMGNRRKDGDPLQNTKALVLWFSTSENLGDTIIVEQAFGYKSGTDTVFFPNIYAFSKIFSAMSSLTNISIDPSTFKILFPLFWAPRDPFTASRRPFPNVTILEQQLTKMEEWKPYLKPEVMLMHIGTARNSITHLEVLPANAAKIFDGPFGSGLFQAFPFLTHIAWVDDTSLWLETTLPLPVTTLTDANSIIPDYPMSTFGPVAKPLPEQIQLVVFRILVLPQHQEDKDLISNVYENHVGEHAVKSWGKLGGRWIVLVEDEGSPLEPLINGMDMWTRAERKRETFQETLEFRLHGISL